MTKLDVPEAESEDSEEVQAAKCILAISCALPSPISLISISPSAEPLILADQLQGRSNDYSAGPNSTVFEVSCVRPFDEAFGNSPRVSANLTSNSGPLPLDAAADDIPAQKTISRVFTINVNGPTVYPDAGSNPSDRRSTASPGISIPPLSKTIQAVNMISNNKGTAKSFYEPKGRFTPTTNQAFSTTSGTNNRSYQSSTYTSSSNVQSEFSTKPEIQKSTLNKPYIYYNPANPSSSSASRYSSTAAQRLRDQDQFSSSPYLSQRIYDGQVYETSEYRRNSPASFNVRDYPSRPATGGSAFSVQAQAARRYEPYKTDYRSVQAQHPPQPNYSRPFTTQPTSAFYSSYPSNSVYSRK